MVGKMLVAAAALIGASTAASATTVVIDSTTNYNSSLPVTIALGAGTYNITPTAGGFTRFSSVSGCDGLGENCSQGYEFSYIIKFNGTEIKFGDGNANGGIGPISPGNGYFATAAQAFANATGGSFTLAAPANVDFYIFDDFIGDNSGTITLDVTAVPEPATWAMMIAGFGLVGGAMRRRKTATPAIA